MRELEPLGSWEKTREQYKSIYGEARQAVDGHPVLRARAPGGSEKNEKNAGGRFGTFPLTPLYHSIVLQ